MTATTSTPGSQQNLLDTPSVWVRIRRATQDTNTVLWRDTVRTLRQPDLLAFAVVMGVFFLVLFNYVFGGSIGAVAGVDYLRFLVPGVFVITALQGAQQTSLGLAADLTEGVIDRFRSLPMSQVAVITGRTIADALRNIAGLILVALWWRSRPRLTRGLLLGIWCVGALLMRFVPALVSVVAMEGDQVAPGLVTLLDFFAWLGSILLLRAFLGLTSWDRPWRRRTKVWFAGLLIFLVLGLFHGSEPTFWIVLAIPWLWSFRWRWRSSCATG